MFDIGFSELMVIAVVALIVIGPERLPKVARTLGHLFGRMQRYVNDVKADISREMELDELRKLQTTMEDAARTFEQSVTQEVSTAESELRKIAQEANPVAPPPSTSLDDLVAAPAHESSQTAGASADASTLSAAEARAQLELDIGSSPAGAEKRA
jgi:sec-independent protein translocase protein TatB